MTEQELAVADKTPTHEGVQRAMAKIAAILPKTPLLPVEVDGVTIWCKAEMLQPIGAFKIRGAWHRLSDLNAEERARGVVGVSSGNHAQGVAYHSHNAPHANFPTRLLFLSLMLPTPLTSTPFANRSGPIGVQ